MPSSYIPWGDVDLKESGPFSDNKFDGFHDDYDGCTAALSRAGIAYTPIPDKTDQSCPLTDQITLDKSLYPYSAPVTGQCSLIAALVNWEHSGAGRASDIWYGCSSITHCDVLMP